LVTYSGPQRTKSVSRSEPLFDSQDDAVIMNPFEQGQSKAVDVTECGMWLELASLKESGGKFAQVFQPEEFVIDERVHLNGPLRLSGRVAQSKSKVVITGQLEGRGHIDCDRCLKPVELPLAGDFRVEYVTPETYEATNQVELNESDMQLSVFDGEAIDLDDLVREQILLTLPSRVLCEDDCKGLCPVCGSDRNIVSCQCETNEIDPRWKALRELVNGK